MPPFPPSPKHLLSTPHPLATLCEHLTQQKIFAFDTEFIGENSYQPFLCLIQVATADRIELIDPLALSRDQLRPFWQLVANPALEKIVHAGDQDIEIAWQQSGLAPQNIFDTQIGAGMLGISYPTALWRAVEHFTGITLEKAHTYSAWDRRPLSKDQFDYAVDDVRYLPAIHAAMKQNLDALNHSAWMQSACDEMCADSARPADARNLFKRIRGAAGLDPRRLAVLREITALREQLAYEHDLPPRTLFKDETLLDIATRLPDSPAALARTRDFPRNELDAYAPALLQSISAGLAVKEENRPTLTPPGEDSAELKRLAESLWVAAQAISLGQGVTPALVTSQGEITHLARLLHQNQPLENHPLLKSWHHQCLGQKLLDFYHAQSSLHLTFQNQSLHATFHDAPPSPRDTP